MSPFQTRWLWTKRSALIAGLVAGGIRTLRPAERQSVREYDRARSAGVVFASEKRHVLELCARGARALPPPRRERLQVLLGKAISAGLVRPWDVSMR